MRHHHRRFILLLLSTSLVVVPAALATNTTIVPGRLGGPPVRVLFLGDSLRGATGASVGSRGYEPAIIAHLARHRTPKKLDPTPITIAGVTTARSYPRIPHADMAFVELGTNDFASRTVAQFRADYRALIARVRQTAVGDHITCISLWRPSNQALTRAFNAVIERACPGAYVGISRHFDESKTRGPAGRRTFLGPGDDFHPNDRGYALIAHDILAHLRY